MGDHQDFEERVSTRIYGTLKWLGLIGCPLLAIVLAGLTPIMNIPTSPEHSMLVVNIIGLSIGIILGFSETMTTQEIEDEENSKKKE